MVLLDHVKEALAVLGPSGQSSQEVLIARSNWQNYQSRSSAHAGTAAWRRLRKEILDRDGWVCMIAGPGCRWDADIVDHIFPVAWGGNDAPENLRAACRTCLAAKTAAESRRQRQAERQAAAAEASCRLSVWMISRTRGKALTSTNTSWGHTPW